MYVADVSHKFMSLIAPFKHQDILFDRVSSTEAPEYLKGILGMSKDDDISDVDESLSAWGYTKDRENGYWYTTPEAHRRHQDYKKRESTGSTAAALLIAEGKSSR